MYKTAFSALASLHSTALENQEGLEPGAVLTQNIFRDNMQSPMHSFWNVSAI